MVFTNPPLWTWAIIVGMIITGKFAYRWYATKELARESEEKSKREKSTSQIRNKSNPSSLT
jgi:hypothetical protein